MWQHYAYTDGGTRKARLTLLSPADRWKDCALFDKSKTLGSSILHTKGTDLKIGGIPDFAALRNYEIFSQHSFSPYLNNCVT